MIIGFKLIICKFNKPTKEHPVFFVDAQTAINKAETIANTLSYYDDECVMLVAVRSDETRQVVTKFNGKDPHSHYE
jgi:hypothetical protein